MGLLTTSQREAIEAGNPIYRHVWTIGVQTLGNTYTWTVLHDDITGAQIVIDPGSRETEAYNQSLGNPGRLPTGDYSIVCDNRDGRFYTTTAGNVWNAAIWGQRQPIQCRVRHDVYVKLISGAWSKLTMLEYEGQVARVQYNDDKLRATISTRAVAMEYLNMEWQPTDAWDVYTGWESLVY